MLYIIVQEEDILFKDSKNSYLVLELSYATYGRMVTYGCLCDEKKVLLHMQQGTAIKGIYLINCMDLHHIGFCIQMSSMNQLRRH